MADRDVTDARRAECERLIAAAGHLSPKGSRHRCARCGHESRWDELRWVERDYPSGPSVVCYGPHDCPGGR